MLLKENKGPTDILTTVSTSLTIRYDIEGSAPRKEEELTKLNSEQDSAATATPTYYYVPEERKLIRRYVWYFPDNTVKPNENRRYVVKSCEAYLQRLSGLVDECKKKCGER